MKVLYAAICLVVFLLLIIGVGIGAFCGGIQYSEERIAREMEILHAAQLKYYNMRSQNTQVGIGTFYKITDQPGELRWKNQAKDWIKYELGYSSKWTWKVYLNSDKNIILTAVAVGKSEPDE